MVRVEPLLAQALYTNKLRINSALRRLAVNLQAGRYLSPQISDLQARLWEVRDFPCVRPENNKIWQLPLHIWVFVIIHVSVVFVVNLNAKVTV